MNKNLKKVKNLEQIQKANIKQQRELGGVMAIMLASYADDPGSIIGNSTLVMCHLAVTGSFQLKFSRSRARKLCYLLIVYVSSIFTHCATTRVRIGQDKLYCLILHKTETCLLLLRLKTKLLTCKNNQHSCDYSNNFSKHQKFSFSL